MLPTIEAQPAVSPERRLSPRESEVLGWVVQGKTNDEIAIIVEASPRTVAKHLERVYRKLGVQTRTAAAVQWVTQRKGTSRS